MKYEISKNFFNQVILDLITFGEMFRLNGHIDRESIKLLDDTIDMLKYYRQFCK